MRNLLAIMLLILPPAGSSAAETPPRAALELRHQAFAELENEHPEKAEPLYRQLTQLLPDEPLGWANLAIAELRQQKYDKALASIAKALAKAPERPRLLAIQAEILQWKGDLDGALLLLQRAADGAPQDLEIQYSLYDVANTTDGERAASAIAAALDRLARLRPENVVVMLKVGHLAIANGNRRRATHAFGRLGELLWQAEPIAERALGLVTEALEGEDLSAAATPAQRLENVLKVTPMYRQSLRELRTGIQGVPLERLIGEPPRRSFGQPLEIEFANSRLDLQAADGRGLVAGDFDGDLRPDLAHLAAGKLEVRFARAGWKIAQQLPAASLDTLLMADLDNDGYLDLSGFGRHRAAVWLGSADGTFGAAEDSLGLAAAGARGAAVIDFDIEGDLDLAVANGSTIDLYRNNLAGPLQRVGDRALPDLRLTAANHLLASDLDRDGDLDLVVAHSQGLSWLDNLRQGRFSDRSARANLAPGQAAQAVVSADLDNDGLPDLVAAGHGLRAWHNQGGSFVPWPLEGLPRSGEFSTLIALDADNDGRFDLAAAGADQLLVLGQRDTPTPSFTSIPLRGAPAGARALVASDLDQDGDLDLAISGAAGLSWLENRGGNRNGWLSLRLRGLAEGNGKNNVFGTGSVVELRHGEAFQFREATTEVTHLGLGDVEKAEVLRVVWTNGVPQNRLRLAGKQRLVEEQILKGSCPFLYAWDGERFAFVTDLLWGAPIGLPAAPGVWVGSDPSELVRADGLRADAASRYRLRITEELWEAAFFDHLRLWVVDHPRDVEVASNLRILPGQALPEKVLASRHLQPVHSAWDGRGHEVTSRVARRDEVYADGYQRSPYQGVAAKPWNFTFDLGAAPALPLRLHLDGWIFPADASLNLALAQRDDLPLMAPRLEVETASGWQTLVAEMGFPAGKTKTMVVDTPALPAGAHRLRIVTSLWLHWDRIAWTTAAADQVPQVRAKLLPTAAELRFRGFSSPRRTAPNGPHVYDYQTVTQQSPWLPFAGRYTRYGDVRELLMAADDLSVVMAAGDEMVLEFDASELPPPAAGWQRSVFLESHGWDKDADRNTYQAQQLEPLPFRGMGSYAGNPPFPDSARHRLYRRHWLTRELPATPQ